MKYAKYFPFIVFYFTEEYFSYTLSYRKLDLQRMNFPIHNYNENIGGSKTYSLLKNSYLNFLSCISEKKPFPVCFSSPQKSVKLLI